MFATPLGMVVRVCGTTEGGGEGTKAVTHNATFNEYNLLFTSTIVDAGPLRVVLKTE